MRKILLLVLVLPVIVVLMVWSFVLRPLAQSKLNTVSFGPDSILSGGPFELFFLGARSTAPLTLHSDPFPLTFENSSLHLSLFSLLGLKPKFDFDSTFLDGRLKGHFTLGIAGQTPSAQFSAESIQIAKYQWASMLGVRAGTLDMQVDANGPHLPSFDTLKASLLVKGVDKPQPSKVPSFISPLPFTIPKIAEGELRLEASCRASDGSRGRCSTSKFEVRSHQGQASGSFSWPFVGAGDLDGAITVALTESGKTDLLPLFGLIDQRLLSQPDKAFILKLSGTNARPKLSVVPLDNTM